MLNVGCECTRTYDVSYIYNPDCEHMLGAPSFRNVSAPHVVRWFVTSLVHGRRCHIDVTPGYWLFSSAGIVR